MDDELDHHLQMEIAENLRKGMTAQQAQSAALRRFGGVAHTKEIYRETHSLPVIQVLQSRFFQPRNSLPDLGNRRQCCSLQLD